MTTDIATLKIAANIARRLHNGWLHSEAERLAPQYNASGQRLAPHHCEHGTNLWTDYDNICGPCEDGWSMGNGIDRRRYALSIASERTARANKLLAACFDGDLSPYVDTTAALTEVKRLLDPTT